MNTQQNELPPRPSSPVPNALNTGIGILKTMRRPPIRSTTPPPVSGVLIRPPTVRSENATLLASFPRPPNHGSNKATDMQQCSCGQTPRATFTSDCEQRPAAHRAGTQPPATPATPPGLLATRSTICPASSPPHSKPGISQAICPALPSDLVPRNRRHLRRIQTRSHRKYVPTTPFRLLAKVLP
jgi:hypothetical protein